ncbi:MAG: arsenite methyltransferase [Chloroflexi bacterium]|jgi:arsenite methyltransferase|nr:arsenite methyltransferase [Chloroflexota bacterium]
MDSQKVKEEVRKHYGVIASQGGCCGSSSSACCSNGPGELISITELEPEKVDVIRAADLGLGCGMPTRSAGIRPGETVLDLGSGAGIDAFLAAREAGPEGRVIGVDMTPEMIARARANAIKGGFNQVEFRLGEIEALPVESESVDVVISNCVINLVPDKAKAFSEIYRVLRPGGRFSISDIVTIGHVPDEIRQDMELWAGCIAGAMEITNYLNVIVRAGFQEVKVSQKVEFDTPQGQDYSFASITVEGRKA